MSENTTVNHNLLWASAFFKDEAFGCLRFKITRTFSAPFEFPAHILYRVSREEFCITEEDRIPLFIGSQFGIAPYFDEVPELFDRPKIIAILEKSMLSGHVAGLSIRQYPGGIDPADRIELQNSLLTLKYFYNV